MKKRSHVPNCLTSNHSLQMPSQDTRMSSSLDRNSSCSESYSASSSHHHDTCLDSSPSQPDHSESEMESCSPNTSFHSTEQNQKQEPTVPAGDGNESIATRRNSSSAAVLPPLTPPQNHNVALVTPAPPKNEDNVPGILVVSPSMDSATLSESAQNIDERRKSSQEREQESTKTGANLSPARNTTSSKRNYAADASSPSMSADASCGSHSRSHSSHSRTSIDSHSTTGPRPTRSSLSRKRSKPHFPSVHFKRKPSERSLGKGFSLWPRNKSRNDLGSLNRIGSSEDLRKIKQRNQSILDGVHILLSTEDEHGTDTNLDFDDTFTLNSDESDSDREHTPVVPRPGSRAEFLQMKSELNTLFKSFESKQQIFHRHAWKNQKKKLYNQRAGKAAKASKSSKDSSQFSPLSSSDTDSSMHTSGTDETSNCTDTNNAHRSCCGRDNPSHLLKQLESMYSQLKKYRQEELYASSEGKKPESGSKSESKSVGSTSSASTSASHNYSNVKVTQKCLPDRLIAAVASILRDVDYYLADAFLPDEPTFGSDTVSMDESLVVEKSSLTQSDDVDWNRLSLDASPGTDTVQSQRDRSSSISRQHQRPTCCGRRHKVLLALLKKICKMVPLIGKIFTLQTWICHLVTGIMRLDLLLVKTPEHASLQGSQSNDSNSSPKHTTTTTATTPSPVHQQLTNLTPKKVGENVYVLQPQKANNSGKSATEFPPTRSKQWHKLPTQSTATPRGPCTVSLENSSLCKDFLVLSLRHHNWLGEEGFRAYFEGLLSCLVLFIWQDPIPGRHQIFMPPYSVSKRATMYNFSLVSGKKSRYLRISLTPQAARRSNSNLTQHERFFYFSQSKRHHCHNFGKREFYHHTLSEEGRPAELKSPRAAHKHMMRLLRCKCFRARSLNAQTEFGIRLAYSNIKTIQSIITEYMWRKEGRQVCKMGLVLLSSCFFYNQSFSKKNGFKLSQLQNYEHIIWSLLKFYTTDYELIYYGVQLINFFIEEDVYGSTTKYRHSITENIKSNIVFMVNEILQIPSESETDGCLIQCAQNEMFKFLLYLTSKNAQCRKYLLSRPNREELQLKVESIIHRNRTLRHRRNVALEVSSVEFWTLIHTPVLFPHEANVVDGGSEDDEDDAAMCGLCCVS